jgi:segregation and condensation protein A
MAATLMMIKSRMLLPVEERPELEPEEDDPRWELVRQLIEYKKFKDAAGTLHEWEMIQGNMFARGTEEVVIEQEPGLAKDDVNIFDLITAFNEAMKRVRVDEIGEIFAPNCTVADKIEAILNRIRQEGEIVFSGLFETVTSRHEVVCTFLALLELIRLRQIDARQSGPFRDIVVVRVGV